MVTGGQLGGEDAGLAFLEPDDRVVETLDQLTGAHLVRQALGRGLRQLLAVHGGRQVDGDEVTVPRGAVDALEGAEARAQRLQLGVDLVVADLDRVDDDLQRAQIGKLDLAGCRPPQ